MRFAQLSLFAALWLMLVACSGSETSKPDGPDNDIQNTFNIDFIFGSGISDDQKKLFEDAATRWEQVITSDLPDTPLTKQENACEQGDPAFEGTVDDLLVYVDVAPRDGSGGVLGASGPCFTREESSLPLYGTLNLDSADLDRPSSLILHELGHVLGLGLLWRDARLIGACPNDLRYSGSSAKGEWHALGGSGDLLVEDKPGAPATQCLHWEGAVFGQELMTSQVKDGDDASLSRVTVGSLEDLGYKVDKDAADAYRLPDVTPQPRSTHSAKEVVLPPTGYVDKNGEVVRY